MKQGQFCYNKAPTKVQIRRLRGLGGLGALSHPQGRVSPASCPPGRPPSPLQSRVHAHTSEFLPVRQVCAFPSLSPVLGCPSSLEAGPASLGLRTAGPAPSGTGGTPPPRGHRLLPGERKLREPDEAAEAALGEAALQARLQHQARGSGPREAGPGRPRTRPAGHRVLRRERLTRHGSQAGRPARPTWPGARAPPQPTGAWPSCPAPHGHPQAAAP